jgi:hypothetical protein
LKAIGGTNAHLLVPALIAGMITGMIAGADSINDAGGQGQVGAKSSALPAGRYGWADLR